MSAGKSVGRDRRARIAVLRRFRRAIRRMIEHSDATDPCRDASLSGSGHGTAAQVGDVLEIEPGADLAKPRGVAAKKRPRGRCVRRWSSRACHCSALVCRRSRISAGSWDRVALPSRNRRAVWSTGSRSLPSANPSIIPSRVESIRRRSSTGQSRVSPPARPPASTPPHCSSAPPSGPAAPLRRHVIHALFDRRVHAGLPPDRHRHAAAEPASLPSRDAFRSSGRAALDVRDAQLDRQMESQRTGQNHKGGNRLPVPATRLSMRLCSHA